MLEFSFSLVLLCKCYQKQWLLGSDCVWCGFDVVCEMRDFPLSVAEDERSGRSGIKGFPFPESALPVFVLLEGLPSGVCVDVFGRVGRPVSDQHYHLGCPRCKRQLPLAITLLTEPFFSSASQPVF